MRRCSDTLIAPDLAQQLDRFGPRKLLADKAGYEPAAANLTLRLHTAERDEQVTPWRCDGFARDEIAKNHPPSQQQLARHRFERLCGQITGGLPPVYGRETPMGAK